MGWRALYEAKRPCDFAWTGWQADWRYRPLASFWFIDRIAGVIHYEGREALVVTGY